MNKIEHIMLKTCSLIELTAYHIHAESDICVNPFDLMYT